MKKLRLSGVPYKIFKNTAFIKGIFNSSMECAKMEGTQIKTVSGIRGQIKKASRTPRGSFRATFEDRILSSDIVYVPVWYSVTVPKYYNQVCSMLQQNKNVWEGMKTVGSLRHELNISVSHRQESSYNFSTCPTRKYKDLKIPRKLHMNLPFNSKPKSKIHKRHSCRPAVLDHQDKSTENLLVALRNTRKRNVVKN